MFSKIRSNEPPYLMQCACQKIFSLKNNILSVLNAAELVTLSTMFTLLGLQAAAVHKLSQPESDDLH